MLLLVLCLSVGCIVAVPLTPQVQLRIENVYEEDVYVNPEQLSGFFEGDIELRPGENPLHRNAVNDVDRTWFGGIVPYEISEEYKDTHVNIMYEAMAAIENATMVDGQKCIHFKPHEGETGYIQFNKGTGCHTPVGYTGRLEKVTLGNGCVRKGTVMHEIMHALGFWHEQSRPDRDSFVTINWDNIQDGHAGNFNKYPTTYVDTLGQPYDYGSIMHYNAYAFAIDREIMTIDPLQEVSIGQRKALSPIDIRKIQLLYGCTLSTPDGGEVTSAPYTTPAPPPTTAAPYVAPTGGDFCDFESGFCTWTQPDTNTNVLMWKRHRGETVVDNTGPHEDHTHSATAYYIFIKAKNHLNRSAELTSKEYSGGDYCVDFYYHMYGAGIESFDLNVVAGDLVFPLKTWRYNHGDVWTHQLLNAHVHTSGTFKFQFVGHIGDNKHGDIALDDIDVHLGDC